VGADLQALCSQAVFRAARMNDKKLELKHIEWARTQVKPSAMREAAIEIPAVSLMNNFIY
jgi:SpoVK/Ycf46/Vps4 family AAA+-type ATPase